jgi:hypothetical protein
LFGAALTIGLHWYKGMVVGLAIQTVMAPLNLIENPLVRALFWSSSRALRPEDRIFEEKELSELTADDEVVDEQGNPVVRRPPPKVSKTSSVEGVLLDTWDGADKADLSSLLAALNSKTCNTQTKEEQWSAIMIVCGLKGLETTPTIKNLLKMGANPALTDKDGWNALHWAAFHGSVQGASVLLEQPSAKNLLSTKDKEGFAPLELARKEGNDTVADLLEKAEGESKKGK